MGDQKRVVLVVDDQENNCEIAVTHLTRLGFTTEEARSAEAALALLQQNPSRFAAVLLDWMMPGMSGLAMFREMQNTPEFAAIPVVIVTARTDTASTAEATAAGVRHFLGKPFGRNELADTLNQIFGG